MGKKIRFNIDSLKVRSFVTSLDDDKKDEVQGGVTPSGDFCSLSCGTFCEYCPNSFECTFDCSAPTCTTCPY